MKKKSLYTVVVVISAAAIFLASCKQKSNDYVKVMHDPLLYTDVVHKLNYVVIYDIFSPPVASRVFAYANLAAYEVLSKEGNHYASLEGKVKGLNNIPAPPDRKSVV